MAGEASGDLHAANLVKEIKSLDANVRFLGMGGKSLAKEGVELLYDAAKLSVVGLAEVFSHLKDIRKARTLLISALKDWQPDLLILIDFPDFNLSLARKAKKLSIPVFYYISPQVWAWRSGRIKTIAKLVDKMVVILPFEKQFYKLHHMEVDFFGHPLVDHVKTRVSAEAFRQQHGIKKEQTLIGILPGSRKKEISSILPLFLQAAREIYKRHPEATFVIPMAPSLSIEEFKCPELERHDLPIEIIPDDRYSLMAACDLVMAASGTVTLELAILNVPMIVAYQISSLTYFLGRKLIKVKYASLVNLVADKEVVEELIQKDFTLGKIKKAIERIWPGTKIHTEMKKQLQNVSDMLGKPGASRRTAEQVMQLIKDKS